MSEIHKLKKYFEGRRLIVPLALGVIVTVYLFKKDFDLEAYRSIKWTASKFFWIFAAIIMLGFRFLGYVYRLYVLSDKRISLRKGFQLMGLWEFCSAISPGIVGGTAAAFIFLSQERNMSVGRSSAIVLATSYLDALFYVIVVPLVLLVTGFYSLIPDEISVFSKSTLISYFWIAYGVFFIWVVILHFGLFKRTDLVKRFILYFFKFRFLNKYYQKFSKWCDDLVLASAELKNESFSFWVKSGFATCLAWFSRFAIVNCLVFAFGNGSEIMDIFAKQLMMWSVLMVPVTPGAIGLAEGLFLGYLGVYFSHLTFASLSVLTWRLITFYPILLLGSIVSPIWINRILREKSSLS